MKKTNKKYPITQCFLYKCQSKKRLEKALVLENGHLKLLDEAIRYHTFEIEKKETNERRKIEAPAYTLKLIQTRVLKLIQCIERPEWLISGQKGKSYISNGETHLNGNFFLTIDIKKFYDNCQREYVFLFFKYKMKTSSDVASILTKIVTYQNGIPTGCPTSQLIAYYAYEDMFNQIHAVAERYGCKFSLYVDDMTFSNVEPFNKKKLEREVDIILRKFGHKPKYKKVHYYSKNECKPITGTIIKPDHQLEVPNKLQQNIYKGFQEIKDVETADLDQGSINKIISLKGRIIAARNIQPERFKQISDLVSEIPTTITKPIIKISNKEKPKKIRIRQSRKQI